MIARCGGRQGIIYQRCRVFDRVTPSYTPSDAPNRSMPKMVAPGQKCRKFRTARAKNTKDLEKLRYSIEINFGKYNARGETISVSLVTSKKYYWFCVSWEGTLSSHLVGYEF